MDEWDLLDEVDVIALWPAEQRKNVDSAKWQERKEALEELFRLIEKYPRLSTASLTIYGEVMDNLKKIIARDSNINVVIAALNVLKGLARGLRYRFSCYIPMIWSVMLDKSKDKKASVRDALSEALDAVSDTCEAERLSKDLCDHLSKPNPQSKQCLCSFLCRYFTRQLTVSMDFAKTVLPVVVKLASDSDPAVRDAACNSLGSARRLLGKGLDAFLSPIRGEKQKLDKIEEYCGEAAKQHSEFMASRSRPVFVDNSAVVDGAEGVESATVIDSCKNQDIDPWTLMDPTDVIAKMRKDFDELIMSKKWQERKEAVDSVLSIVENAPRVAMSPELHQLVMVMIKVLEKDVNINVCSVCAKVLAKLATSMRTDFAEVVPKIMPVAFEKLKEKKAVLRSELIELCDAASFTASLECYSEAVCGGLTKANPQSKAQTAQFAARLLSRHDSSTVPIDAVKQIVPGLIKCSSDADAEVRESAFRAMAAVLRCVGEPVARRLFGEVSEDKIKMGKLSVAFSSKIMEFVVKIREDFGEKAAPEIIKLHGSTLKNAKPTAAQSYVAPAFRKPLSAAKTAHRPVLASRPSTTASVVSNRVPCIAERSSALKAPLQQQTQRLGILGPGRTPVGTRSVQPVGRGVFTKKPFDAPASSHHMRNRPAFAPNIVRTTTSQQANAPNRTKPAGTGPVKITNKPSTLSFNGFAPGRSATPKVNTGLQRSNSGLRPPTTVSRISGTSIPRLSRPSSPAK